MSDLQKSVRAFTADVTPLVTSETAREESYYPAVRNLLLAVLKKWLGNRDARRRNNRPLSLAEEDYFRAMVQRIAALLSLHQRLNELYERASTDAWTADVGETASGSPT